MKIVGYGICAPGEASRYMRETMEEFKRLCDVVVILVNCEGWADDPNVQGYAEIQMIEEYGFKYALDGREWGKMQWKIKQDFLQREVAKYADDGDMVVCLDMDETLDRRLDREWLLSADMDAYHVFVVDLWNDPQHYKPASCFWNVRIFRWNGMIDFTKKALHCGLAPEWARAYNRYAPFLLLHKGLMAKADRQRKIERYEKYDPHAQYLAKPYYAMIRSDTAEPFDETKVHATISAEVATYKQSRPRGPSLYMNKKEQRFAYFTNAAGFTVDVPEKHVALTMKQPGMKFIGWADDAAKEIEELFEGDDESIVEEDAELEDADLEKELGAPDADAAGDDELDEEEEADPGEPELPAGHASRVGVEKQPRPVKRVSTAKKAVKKTAKKTAKKVAK